MSALNKELIWVPEERAKAYNAAETDAAKLEILDELIAKTKRSIRQDLENLDDDRQIWEASLLRYKQMYKDALSTHNANIEAAWEEIQKTIPNINRASDLIAERIQTLESPVRRLKGQVDEISRCMESINVYHLERILAVLEKMEQLSDRSRAILYSGLNNASQMVDPQ